MLLELPVCAAGSRGCPSRIQMEKALPRWPGCNTENNNYRIIKIPARYQECGRGGGSRSSGGRELTSQGCVLLSWLWEGKKKTTKFLGER